MQTKKKKHNWMKGFNFGPQLSDKEREAKAYDRQIMETKPLRTGNRHGTAS